MGRVRCQPFKTSAEMAFEGNVLSVSIEHLVF